MFKFPYSFVSVLHVVYRSPALCNYITFFCSLVLLTVCAVEEIEDFPKIEIPDGKFRGLWMYTTTGRPIEAYLRIPYASPPVGKLRFQAPVDPNPWFNVRNATVDPSPCVQFSKDPLTGEETLIGQEDCLYLNVFKPKDLEYSRRQFPILVYIHGGGLYESSSTIEDFGPQFLLNEDILLVTFNYRLDVLGFLSTEDEEAPGNNGFKDQVAALKWVRKNIEYFGGDPQQVTVFGQSAGGYSVHYLMLSQCCKGLFQKAVSSSGNIYTLYPFPKGLVAERTRLLAEYVECLAYDSAILIKCLQNLPVEKLFNYLYKFKIFGDEPGLSFGPVVEPETNGSFITLNSLSYSDVSVPWLTGITSEEGLTYTAGISIEMELLNQLENEYNKLAPVLFCYDYHMDKHMISSLMKQFYFKEDKISHKTIPQLTNVIGDSCLLFGILKSLTLHNGPVYLYYFTHRGEYSHTDQFIKYPHFHNAEDEIEAYIRKSVCHGDELQFIFPMMRTLKYRKNLNLSKSDEKVSKEFIQLLYDFMSQRNLADFKWKPTSLESLNYIHMDTTGFTMKDNLLPTRTHFWSHWIYPPEKEILKEEL